MRLKTVRVHGFKTFANSTEFSFQDGITAIVGPNGCGKSNIADAIRWALGEQSPSNLRTKKTEDLIFTGSATRPKMGMAEVALTLENPFAFEVGGQGTNEDAGNDSPLVIRPDTSSRQARHPSAIRDDSSQSDSDNGSEPQRARPSIVEEILQTRPTEVTLTRRAYRSGENEYLVNRQRVRLRDVQELLQRWGLARLTYAVIGQGLVDQALSLRAEERRLLFEEAAGIGLYQNKKALALEKLQETEQNLVRVNDIINEIAPRLPSLARQADRASKYESVATALAAHLKQWYAYNWAHAQEGFIAAMDQETHAREKLNARRAVMQELAAQLTETRRTAQTLRAKLADHRRAQQQRETEFAAHERELAVLQERARFAESQHADAQRDMDAANAQAESAAAALEQFPAQPLTLDADPVPTEFAAAAAPGKENQNAIAELQAQHRAALEQIAAKQREAEARQNARVEKLAQAEENANAEWNAQSERLSAEMKRVDEESRARLRELDAQLDNERERMEHERARTLARQRLAQLRLQEFDASFSPNPSEALTLSAESEVQVPPDLAQHLISLREELPLYESALASVASLAVQANDLARRERALREREKLLERVRQEGVEAKNALALAERDAQAARQAQRNAQRERERIERERKQERERSQHEQERERERMRVEFEREREKIAREGERLRAEHERTVRERERILQDRVREQERESERMQERALEQQRAQQRELERIHREQALERERRARERERARQERDSRAARVSAFAGQLAEIISARDAAQIQVDEMRAGLQELKDVAFPDEAALNDSERLQNELEEREVELRSELTVADELYNRAVLEAERRRAEIARLEQEIEDDLGPVELDSAAPRQLRLRLVVRSQNPTLISTLAGDGEGQIENLPADSPDQELVTLPEVDVLPDGFDKEIRRLKNQMRYIGNVNPNAPQEYAELKERHAFLTEQAADLTQAIEKLQQATRELDAMMQQKFQETFDAINTQFKKYFAMLFGGGSARLELTDQTDLIHSGIEIIARPPGKRAAQLVLLSGGERALTAAALIFSILKVSPTPFCVMDEVDAALDEANVGRFREGLKELSDASQFIVITHNRVTMEGARAIYGVSMGEDGVSQVLSLKLEVAVPEVA